MPSSLWVANKQLQLQSAQYLCHAFWWFLGNFGWNAKDWWKKNSKHINFKKICIWLSKIKC